MKKTIAIFLLAATVLTACGKSTESNDAVSNRGESGTATEQEASGSMKQAGATTVSDLLEKYDSQDESQMLMPLYNVAPDEAFDFTFKANADDIPYTDLGVITVHSDSACEEESIIYTYFDYESSEDGCVATVSPIAPVMETESEQEQYVENDISTWGNAPCYYIAIRYDIESTDWVELDKPIIIPFTIKHEVEAPNVRRVIASDGAFSLEWDPVEGAEEYRVYQLVDETQWCGVSNEPVDGAKSGYSNASLILERTTTDTHYEQFAGAGTESRQKYERAVSDREYIIAQNTCVCGEYYVSAVVDGKESGFAEGVRTDDVALPYSLYEEDDIMFTRYMWPSDLPLTVRVLNIDGSISEHNVIYTLQKENTYDPEYQTDEYAYVIEGTAMTGCVGLDYNPELSEEDYPKTIGKSSTVGKNEPENDISKQPGSDVETIIEVSDSKNKKDNLIGRQKDNTQKHIDNAKEHATEKPEDGVVIFADTAEEEWIALNMVNAENKISMEAFPRMQMADELEDVLYKVYYQNPYVLGLTRFSYDYSNMELEVEYAYDKDEIRQMQSEINKEAQKIVDENTTPDMTDEEKRKALYHYLENNTTYDYEALQDAEKNNMVKTGDDTYEYAFNTYGILVKKVGVCQSYAYAYKLLCNLAGVECNVVTGYLDGNLPHAWNAVKIDDAWYETDTTNNVTNTSIPYFLYNSDSEIAANTGYTTDELFEIDNELSEYENYNKDYEYYYSNERYAEDMDEYVDVLTELLKTDADNLCVRFEGTPDVSEFEQAVTETYSKLNREEELSNMGYAISNSYIVMIKK